MFLLGRCENVLLLRLQPRHLWGAVMWRCPHNRLWENIRTRNCAVVCENPPVRTGRISHQRTWSTGGQLVSGGWAIETYWRHWSWGSTSLRTVNGETKRRDFYFGPLRLLRGTSNHGEYCHGNCLILYTPFNYEPCKDGECFACYHKCENQGVLHKCWRTQKVR